MNSLIKSSCWRNTPLRYTRLRMTSHPGREFKAYASATDPLEQQGVGKENTPLIDLVVNLRSPSTWWFT